MIRPPSGELLSAFGRYVTNPARGLHRVSFSTETGSQIVELPSVTVADIRVVLVNLDETTDISLAVQALKGHSDWLLDGDDDVREVLIAVGGMGAKGSPKRTVRLGVSAVPLHRAIADLVGLPAGWFDRQQKIIEQILEPLRVGQQYRVARLQVPGENGEEVVDALDWLDGGFRWGGTAAGRLTYIRAEAGKGKSTTFAEFTRRRLVLNDGPLPVLVPLRDIRRGAGASWDAITASMGILGSTVEDLARAVRAGLVLLLLDGLDEVSGRYDPAVIRDVVDSVAAQTRGRSALLAFSGRTTEGLLLDKNQAHQRTLELPDVAGAEFRTYAEQVIDGVVPEWPALAARLPEPPVQALKDRPLTAPDRDHILKWVLFTFGEFGKDRSLFFVQSLACLARTFQLDGNRPLYVWQADSPPKVAPCRLYDVCVLAASLACVREQEKIDGEVQHYFTPDRQLELATWFAVLASIDASLQSSFPTPNQLIAHTFDLDTVHQGEEFIAITRQMQKHALLYSTGSGVAAGDWRPAFLSEWVKAALLARAWSNRQNFPKANPADVARGVARAQRSRIAFEYIFPDLGAEQREEILHELATLLVKEADADSPEACGNFWFLMQGLRDDWRATIVARPKQIVPLTDLSGVEFEGHDFGPEFSGTYATFVGTSFSNCTFVGCRFSQCDFTGAEFLGCKFTGCVFEYCDGPVVFENCREVSKTRFEHVRSQVLPAWEFIDCEFDSDCRVTQKELPRPDAYAPLASFADCTHAGELAAFLIGPELGQDIRRFKGLNRTTAPTGDKAVTCLRQLLRPFFPTRVGDTGTYQARDYIRSSAIGRGVYPPGSPGPGELTSFLSAEKFTKGGRQGHLYAPWSEVAGTTRPELRSELATFVRNISVRGPTVQILLEKIRKSARWSP